MSDNWESEFRKQVALDGHTIEILDNENAQLSARVSELEKQCGSCVLSPQKSMEINLDRQLRKIKEQSAIISELENQVDSMREESINIAESLIFAVNKKDISNIERQNIFDKAKMFIDHWQPRGNNEGGGM